MASPGRRSWGRLRRRSFEFSRICFSAFPQVGRLAKSVKGGKERQLSWSWNNKSKKWISWLHSSASFLHCVNDIPSNVLPQSIEIHLTSKLNIVYTSWHKQIKCLIPSCACVQYQFDLGEPSSPGRPPPPLSWDRIPSFSKKLTWSLPLTTLVKKCCCFIILNCCQLLRKNCFVWFGFKKYCKSEKLSTYMGQEEYRPPVPVPKNWEWFSFTFSKVGKFSIPVPGDFPFPKVGNAIYHSLSCSQILGMGSAILVPVPKSHSHSLLTRRWFLWHKIGYIVFQSFFWGGLS